MSNTISAKFYEACMEFYDNNYNPLQKNILQRIGDRQRFIDTLEKHGLAIVDKLENKPEPRILSPEDVLKKNLNEALIDVEIPKRELNVIVSSILEYHNQFK